MISLKDAFYIIDLAAEIFFENLEADEKEKWGGWEGKVRGQNVPLCLW